MKRPTMGSLTLTTLADIAIDEILTRLPIKDAVRTSVLSRAWRRRWHSIPALDLRDLSDVAISQLLVRHSSPVKSCDFRPLPKKNKEEEPCPIYCWLSTLSLRSASTLLSLTLFFDGSLSINSLAGYFPNLTNLCLSCHLSISPDCFSGIPNLRTLHLEYFSTNLSLLVSQFPLLEKLIVENMGILSEGENSNTEEEPSSDIVTPNLRWLELFNVRLDNFNITNAPLPETLIVSHCLDEDGNSWLLLEVIAGAPRVKRLEVDDMCLGVWAWNVKQDAEGKMSMRIPVVMDNLRVMSLSVMFTSKKQIALALYL